jgi:spore maturation protein CgeB
VENLFTPGRDFLVASDGHEMEFHLKNLLANKEMAQTLAQRGHRTVLDRHTCAHRVDELLEIYAEIEGIPQEEMVTA